MRNRTNNYGVDFAEATRNKTHPATCAGIGGVSTCRSRSNSQCVKRSMRCSLSRDPAGMDMGIVNAGQLAVVRRPAGTICVLRLDDPQPRSRLPASALVRSPKGTTRARTPERSRNRECHHPVDRQLASRPGQGASPSSLKTTPRRRQQMERKPLHGNPASADGRRMNVKSVICSVLARCFCRRWSSRAL